MTEVVVRCGEHAKKAPVLARVTGGVLEWTAREREAVTWDGSQSLDPIRPRGVTRRDDLELLATDPPPWLVWSAYLELQCRDHGRVLGPRWAQLLEFSRGLSSVPITVTATRVRD